MTSDSLNASASTTTALAAAPVQNTPFTRTIPRHVRKRSIYNTIDVRSRINWRGGNEQRRTHSFMICLSTVLLPPPIRRSTGLRSLCAAGTITSVLPCRCWSWQLIPMALSSSISVESSLLVTFSSLVTLSNLIFLIMSNQRTELKLNIEL
jgi:hypothetical protein